MDARSLDDRELLIRIDERLHKLQEEVSTLYARKDWTRNFVYKTLAIVGTTMLGIMTTMIALLEHLRK